MGAQLLRTWVLTRETMQLRAWLAWLLVRKMSKDRTVLACAASTVYCALTASTVELQFTTCACKEVAIRPALPSYQAVLCQGELHRESTRGEGHLWRDLCCLNAAP